MQTLRMEEAFDPFGLEEVNNAVEQTKEQSAVGGPHGTPPTSSSQRDSSFDLFPTSLSDPFAPVVSNSAANPKAKYSDDAFESGEESPTGQPPIVSHMSRNSSGNARTGTLALPPKLNVKLSIHEEVSSTAIDSDGTSQVFIEGEIKAQVQCSDALKNAPFVLTGGPSTVFQQHWKITAMSDVAKPLTAATNNSKKNLADQFTVHIPKHEIGWVPTARFSLSGLVQHMPILLERKIMMSGANCRVAVQVRSKLSNVGNLHDFSIALAVPEAVKGDSIQIVRGNGNYDELKRTIHWKLPELQRGSSFMVSAQLSLWEEGQELSFPVILRCTSQSDQIGQYQAFSVTSADTYPSSVTFTTQRSVRLLHRLT